MRHIDPHLKEVNQNIEPKTPDGCEECLQMGSDWVHLRLCLSCGHVGCCDNSPNKHATKHFKSTKHPIIRSFEPGETWEWCYVDNILIGSHPSQKKDDKIKTQDAKKEEVLGKNKYLKDNPHSSFLQSSSSPNRLVSPDSLMKKSQTRVRKTLEGTPEFVMSSVETQNVLKKLAKYKTNFVVLHVDLVGSTKLAMRLPLDRLTMMIQAFNQEMSVIVTAFGGYVLKYVGDAVLAFFVVPGHKSEAKAACINAVNCAKYMIRIAREAINPILNQYGCPEMNLRIGIDIGENAIIQSGWDIHPNIRNRRKNNKNIVINHNKKQQRLLVKKPVYDILSYTISIAVKMTALANPNHIVIGDPMYNVLNYKQRSAFEPLNLSPDIWSYVCRNSERKSYIVYTDV
ncbi:MAG TPA: UBP-type zinc finger domain-containing protein [Nitrososphaeraceae archaeon]|nr:UBP-type zinc finger domain-containing protein [Nitrososphaeraceae archaeon]